MLPGYVAGHYQYDECHIDLQPLAKSAGASFVRADVNQIDTGRKVVGCSNGQELEFDVVSINTGAMPATGSVQGAEIHATTVKPINSFIESWQSMLDQISHAEKPLNIAVVGGGAGGVELLLAIHYRLSHLQRRAGTADPPHAFYLFADSPVLLPSHPARVQRKFARLFSEKGIRLLVNRRVTGVTPAGLQCEDGSEFTMDHVVLVTHAAAPRWVEHSGLATDKSGFLLVNDGLQSLSCPDVFAAGDIAASINHPRPKAGVIAVRQGPVLAANLRRHLHDQPLRTFRPQKQFLALISCGEKYAVASRGKLVAEGAWLWRLKDWIDRGFIRKYSLDRH